MAKLLPVSAPFHSSLMGPAAERMAAALASTDIAAPVTPLVANVTAEATADPAAIREHLVKQVTGRVRWTESVTYMRDKGCEDFIEVGSGKVLAGLIRRICKDTRTLSVGEPGDIDAFAKF
jgi:[acyl-carrier-protein] S-malonyltransferase